MLNSSKNVIKENVMTEYTDKANQFIKELLDGGYGKDDIFTHFVKGGKVVIYPVIGEMDGKPHLKKITFR